MTLYGDFLRGGHRRTGKWMHYFPIYERHLNRFQNRYVTLLEIGVSGGGSLQLWRNYLGPMVRIIGIDVDPNCRKAEEDQIDIRIGSQADHAFLGQVIAEFGNPDIVIDDGSHQQEHINAAFDFLYPKVAKNGVYIIEDLHTAYWESFGGGLRRHGTFIERTKGFIDELHAGYTGGSMSPTEFGIRTDSIHCYDSVVVFEIGEQRRRFDRWIGTEPEWETPADGSAGPPG